MSDFKGLYIGRYARLDWVQPDILEEPVRERIEAYVDQAIHEAVSACMFCESAIEKLLMVELRLQAMRRYAPGRFYIFPQHEASTERSNYRADFLLSSAHPDSPRFDLCAKLVVECDGREFHTGEDDVLRDKQRDRALLKSGMPVIRFTGRELLYDPEGCASEALSVFESLLSREPVVASSYE